MKRDIAVVELRAPPVAEQEIEIVERKGVGHPDYICDALAEACSEALASHYLATCGHVLHFNVDKALLLSGRVSMAFGAGEVVVPMTFVLGGQATYEWQNHRFPVADLITQAGVDWVHQHLRFVDPAHDVVFRDEARPGSPTLVDIYLRQPPVANDTSVGVGYAPLSATEALTLALERHINSSAFKRAFPASGEDVKVMAVRRGYELTLIVAMPLVSRFITSAQRYFALKDEMHKAMAAFVRAALPANLGKFALTLNALDVPNHDLAGVYLTVTGTSAEAGDAGQVGRGNRSNGLISYMRPLGIEAPAGKNPAAHVGKIYTLLSYRLASEIYETVPGIREVYVRLCSRIGSPIDQPLLATAELALRPDISLATVAGPVRRLVDSRLAAIEAFTDRLARGLEPAEP